MLPLCGEAIELLLGDPARWLSSLTDMEAKGMVRLVCSVGLVESVEDEFNE